MARHSIKHYPTDSNQAEALQIARGTQRPGQHREQTRLIAQGIQKGTEHCKKQQNIKARNLDKELNKVYRQIAPSEAPEIEALAKVICKRHRLLWLLLVPGWAAITAYCIFSMKKSRLLCTVSTCPLYT